jgi:rubrerythrin
MFTIGEIIDLAIRIEKNGEKVYREAIQRLSNPSLVSLLQWLADEEAAHGRWFAELKDKVKIAVADPRLEEMSKGILQGILGEQSFSLEDADFSEIGQVGELLSLAIEFEEDTVLFYEMIGSVLDDEGTVKHLNSIIEEEKRHVQVLKAFLEGPDD